MTRNTETDMNLTPIQLAVLRGLLDGHGCMCWLSDEAQRAAWALARAGLVAVDYGGRRLTITDQGRQAQATETREEVPTVAQETSIRCPIHVIILRGCPHPEPVEEYKAAVARADAADIARAKGE